MTPEKEVSRKPRYRRRRQTRTPKTQEKTSRAVEKKDPQPANLSVVVPIYNEEGSLDELTEELKAVLGGMGMPYEIIFVDDGSTDKSFDVLKEIYRRNKRIKVVRFRANFGKSAALATGFQHASGNIVVTIDADLQDDPAEIPALVRELKKGYDVVSGWKKKRRDPITKTIPSRFFNFVVRIMTGIKIHDFNCGLKVYRKEVVKNIKVYGELHRFIPVLAHWQGYTNAELIVNHRPRRYGKTKFGISRFFKGFLDFLTVLFTTRFSARPLHLFGTIGIISFSVGFAIDAYLTILWALGKTTLSNRPLLLAGFLLIIVGIQFIAIGLLGEMITRTQKPEEEYTIRDVLG